MQLRSMILAAVGTACASAAVPASATSLTFMLTGSRDASFSLDTDEAPAFYNMSSLIGDQVGYDNVNGVFGGTAESASVNFGTYLIATLNISAAGLGFTQFAGPDLFKTVDGNPVFNLGTFALTSIGSGNSTLTISASPAAVPEPGSWALVMGGIGMAGGVMRRQRRATGKVTFA